MVLSPPETWQVSMRVCPAVKVPPPPVIVTISGGNVGGDSVVVIGAIVVVTVVGVLEVTGSHSLIEFTA